MKTINIVFDDLYNDVALLLVPDEIADSVDMVVWEFNNWLSVSDNQQRFLVPYTNETMVLAIGTEEFLWWLNHVKIIDKNKASIIRQHTQYVPSFPTAHF